MNYPLRSKITGERGSRQYGYDLADKTVTEDLAQTVPELATMVP